MTLRSACMERVSGIGGVFFRAADPAALKRWYEEHLGVTMTPTDYAQQSWRQEAGTTVFEPFPRDTDYFGQFARLYDPEGNPVELWEPK